MSPEETKIRAYTKNNRFFEELNSLSLVSPIARQIRFKLFIGILKNIPAVSRANAAKFMVDCVLNTVEDQFSGVGYSPNSWRTDFRMYPANEDYRRESASEKVHVYAHVAHLSMYGMNGAFLIKMRKPPFDVLINRPGDDGRKIYELLSIEPVSDTSTEPQREP